MNLPSGLNTDIKKTLPPKSSKHIQWGCFIFRGDYLFFCSARQEIPMAAMGEPMLWRTMEKMLLVVDGQSSVVDKHSCFYVRFLLLLVRHLLLVAMHLLLLASLLLGRRPKLRG